MQVKTKLYICSYRTARTFSAVRNELSEPNKKLSTSSLGFYFEECCIGWGRGFSRENRSTSMPFWFGSIAETARLMKGGSHIARYPVNFLHPRSAFNSAPLWKCLSDAFFDIGFLERKTLFIDIRLQWTSWLLVIFLLLYLLFFIAPGFDFVVFL